MTDDNTTEVPEEPQSENVDQHDTPEVEGGVSDATPEGSDPEPDTFTREYVESLRQENGRYRQRASRADELAHRLHTELVRATGRLADPSDLPFDESHLEAGDNMSSAIDDLLTRKPHLATRRPTGDIGQGGVSAANSNVDLAAILRGKAG